MNNIEKQNLIISKLLEDNWNIESVEYTGRCKLIATKNLQNMSEYNFRKNYYLILEKVYDRMEEGEKKELLKKVLESR